MDIQDIGTITAEATDKKITGLPLIDPQMDLVAVEGVQLPGAFDRAYAQVCQRATQDQLVMSYEGNVTKPFPVMPGICCLHKEAEKILRQRLKIVFGAFQKIVSNYHSSDRLREFMAIPEVLNRWIMEDSEPAHRTIDLCRFDMMGGSLDDLRIIEFNANSPGGIVYGGLIDSYWREAPGIEELIGGWNSQPMAFESPTFFAGWIGGLARRHGIESFGDIGLVHPIGGHVFELPYLQQRLQHQGYACALMSPAQAAHGNTDRPRVVYLKYGVQRSMRDIADIAQWGNFCAHVVNGHIFTPSSLAARWVGDNKLCLVAMSDPRFAFLFTPAEREVMRQMIPWSRKLGDGIDARELLTDKDRFVIKNPYGSRGDGVWVGLDYTHEEWKAIVSTSAGFVVQEFVDSSSSIAGAPSYFRDMTAIIASGRVVGYGSRVSRKRKLNMAQESKRLTVLSALTDA